MTYVPHPGTVAHKAIEHLKTLPPGLEISTSVLADAIDSDTATVSVSLRTAVKNGLVRSSPHPENRRMLIWSIGNGTTPAGIPGEEEEDEGELRTRSTGVRPVIPIDPKWPFPPSASNSDSAAEAEPPAPAPGPAAVPPAGAVTFKTRRRMQAIKAIKAVQAAQQAEEQLTEMRLALWSDGTLQIQRPGQAEVLFPREETRKLVRYLERMAESEEQT